VRKVYLVTALLWAGVIAFFSLIPAAAMEGYPIDSSKSWVYHIVSYFILALLLQRTDLLQNRYVILIAILYGFVIEVVQNFIPGRYFDLWDIAANSAGALGGALLPDSVFKILSGLPEGLHGQVP